MDNHKDTESEARTVAAWICKSVGIFGIAIATAPCVLSGSIGWALASVAAGIVVYYAGAAEVVSRISND